MLFDDNTMTITDIEELVHGFKENLLLLYDYNL